MISEAINKYSKTNQTIMSEIVTSTQVDFTCFDSFVVT